jgi:hypothetical protein
VILGKYFLSKLIAQILRGRKTSQIQGDKNYILPKKINANQFFRETPHWLKIWKNHLCPSVGPNGGSEAVDSAESLCVKEPFLAQFNTLSKASVYN